MRGLGTDRNRCRDAAGDVQGDRVAGTAVGNRRADRIGDRRHHVLHVDRQVGCREERRRRAAVGDAHAEVRHPQCGGRTRDGPVAGQHQSGRQSSTGVERKAVGAIATTGGQREGVRRIDGCCGRHIGDRDGRRSNADRVARRARQRCAGTVGGGHRERERSLRGRRTGQEASATQRHSGRQCTGSDGITVGRGATAGAECDTCIGHAHRCAGHGGRRNRDRRGRCLDVHGDLHIVRAGAIIEGEGIDRRSVAAVGIGDSRGRMAGDGGSTVAGRRGHIADAETGHALAARGVDGNGAAGGHR